MVDRGKQIAIAPRRLLELLLLRGHCRAALLHSLCLRLCWTSLHTTCPAIKADSIYGGVIVDHRGVVHVVDNRRIDVGDVSVVVVISASPVAAIKATTGIAVSVIDSAIEPNHGPPIASIPHIKAVVECPVARCPKQSDFRWQHPSSGHPVIITGVVIRPIAGHPDVAFTWANRLRVHR